MDGPEVQDDCNHSQRQHPGDAVIEFGSDGRYLDEKKRGKAERGGVQERDDAHFPWRYIGKESLHEGGIGRHEESRGEREGEPE